MDKEFFAFAFTFVASCTLAVVAICVCATWSSGKYRQDYLECLKITSDKPAVEQELLCGS